MVHALGQYYLTLGELGADPETQSSGLRASDFQPLSISAISELHGSMGAGW